MEDNLQTAQNRTDHFQKMLTDTSRQMTQIAATDEIQPILETLIRETEAALADHGKFSGQLSAANKTIAQLQAELNTQSNLARIDELTQLYNRRHLHREAPGILRQAARTGKPLSAIMFDLDRFKRINDTWGHNFGDKVLAQCAAIIKRAARPDDLAVRLGGEEFLLLCPNDPLDQAVETAENIRLEIASTDMTVRGNSLFVTISGGVAQYVVGEGMQEFLGRADQALYQAKNDGRNRICRTTERSDEVASFNPLPIPPGSH
jgi:diguanylate cyclase (GGDEF)-like protein